MTGRADGAYRPDIDGLRAIAVLAVITHHLGSHWLPGGYTGVDVFFVISGFLITSLVWREQAEGSFSVRRFYQRRINRLLPALIVVLIAATVVGFLLLSPSDLVTYAQSVFFSLIGLSNIFFWREYGNYFGAAADQAPLLHTWTLGVEEQFYLVWPWLLLAAARFSPRRVIPLALLVTVGGLVVSEIGVQEATSASYYLLPTRFFELAIGGTLALVLRRRSTVPAPLASVAGIAGLALILAGFILLSPETPFPGINALIPCVGAGLIILAGTRTTAFTTRLLSLPVMVAVGLMSYSLYLWHWPFIVYTQYVGVEITPPVGIAILAAVVLLSWATWRWVEVPWRRSGARLSFGRVFARRFALPAIVGLLLAVFVTGGHGLRWRFDERVDTLEAMAATHPEELRAGCHVPNQLYATPPSEACRLGALDGPIDGVLLGDSFANHFTGMLEVMARHEGWAFIDHTMDGCPPILGYVAPGLSSYSGRCRARNDASIEWAADQGVKTVILAGHWPDDPTAETQIRATLDRLLAAGIQVTVILESPSIREAATCPIRRLMYPLPRDCTGAPPPHAPYWEAIRRDHPSVSFLDVSPLICPGDICDPMLDGVLLYRDDGHLDDVGSRLLGRLMVAQGARIRPSDEVGGAG